MQNLRWPALMALALLMLPLTALASEPAALQQIDVDTFPTINISKHGGRDPQLSGDGSVVIFRTYEALVADDLNEDEDHYLFDRESGQLEFLGNAEATADDDFPTGPAFVTDDGRYVIFGSTSPYYVEDDTNGESDVFRYDRATGAYERLNRDGAGEIFGGASPIAITSDGRYVAVSTSAQLLPEDEDEDRDIYILDVIDGTVGWLHPRSDAFRSLTLSDDGRYAAFSSFGSDLIADDTNENSDVFVLDRTTDEITRVSLTADGLQADGRSAEPAISADGRYVTFESTAALLEPHTAGGHVYLYDREAGVLEQIDVASNGESATGDSLILSTTTTGRTVSDDGRYAVFSSSASNLVPNDTNETTDVFRRDRIAGTTELVSRSAAGIAGESYSSGGILSSDGQAVVFVSEASNLDYLSEDDGIVQGYGDLNVFVRDMQAAYPPSPFTLTHERTDRPVAEGQAQRTWTWGPEPFTPIMYEPYGASNRENVLPFEHRQVQYFDKARMEITHPTDDPNSAWYTTNGLLVVEMMTGELQVSDEGRLQLGPANVNVAGDANDPHGPTYASLAPLRDAPAHPAAQPITARVDRDGAVSIDNTLASYNVEVAIVDDVTGHGIAVPFWSFMNSSDVVWDGNGYDTDQLFENPYFATGRPLIEAYWAEVLVGGQPRDVLMQCFERRCLTYTPGNPEGFIVEAGNVGRHYYEWRYTVQPLAPELDGTLVYAALTTLNVVTHAGATEIFAGPEDMTISALQIAPDSSQIAFAMGRSFGNHELYIVNADGSNLRQMTIDGYVSGVSWSPDDNQLVFGSDGMVAIVNADGSGRTDIAAGTKPAWSPLGDRIAYIDVGSGAEMLMTTNVDGTEPFEVVGAPIYSRSPTGLFSGYAWSPDGTRFVYASGYVPVAQMSPLYLLNTINADGTGDSSASASGSMGTNPGWSPDGNRLTYVREHIVYSSDLTGADVRGLLWDFSQTVTGYDWISSS